MYEEFLASLEPFRDLTDAQRCRLSDILHEEVFEDDEIIFRIGDPSDALYLVHDGSVVLYTEDLGQPVRLLARLGPGSVLGEIGLQDGSGRGASARASGPTKLLKLPKSDFDQLVHTNPAVGSKLTLLAMSRQFENFEAALELGRRREVRVRVGKEIVVRDEEGRPNRATLEDISFGGCRLAGLPPDWLPERSFTVSFELDAQAELLYACGRIIWRQDDKVGIAFTDVSAAHQQRVRRLLLILLG
jgi:CRP-like cAMP-binding protein